MVTRNINSIISAHQPAKHKSHSRFPFVPGRGFCIMQRDQVITGQNRCTQSNLFVRHDSSQAQSWRWRPQFYTGFPNRHHTSQVTAEATSFEKNASFERRRISWWCNGRDMDEKVKLLVKLGVSTLLCFISVFHEVHWCDNPSIFDVACRLRFSSIHLKDIFYTSFILSSWAKYLVLSEE